RPASGARPLRRQGRPTGIRVPPTPPAGPADWHPGPAHSAGRAGRLASGSRRLRLGGRAVVGAVVLWCRSAATSAPDLKRGSLAIEGTLDSTIVQITCGVCHAEVTVLGAGSTVLRCRFRTLLARRRAAPPPGEAGSRLYEWGTALMGEPAGDQPGVKDCHDIAHRRVRR